VRDMRLVGLRGAAPERNEDRQEPGDTHARGCTPIQASASGTGMGLSGANRNGWIGRADAATCRTPRQRTMATGHTS
jgi:hypothetical protein